MRMSGGRWALMASESLCGVIRASAGVTEKCATMPMACTPVSVRLELCKRGAQRVVVTAGKEPVLAFDGKSFWRITVPQIKAVNTIGSGDAFTAGLVWRLVRGDDLGEACRWGCAAGAANALTPMPGEVNRADADRLAREVEVMRISQ